MSSGSVLMGFCFSHKEEELYQHPSTEQQPKVSYLKHPPNNNNNHSHDNLPSTPPQHQKEDRLVAAFVITTTLEDIKKLLHTVHNKEKKSAVRGGLQEKKARIAPRRQGLVSQCNPTVLNRYKGAEEEI